VRVAVVAVGDELLLGDVVNGNLAWLGRALADAGTPVIRGYEVGDAVEEIAATLRLAIAAADAVVVTGGLGPTSDDRTRAALAEVAGVELRRDPELETGIAGWYARVGRVAPDNVWVQADIPMGAHSIDNPTGTAPGLAMEIDGRPVYALPGVPGELRNMFTGSVLPELRARAGGPPPLVTRQLRVAVMGESLVATLLRPLEARLPADVQISYLGSPGEVLVRLSGTDPSRLEELAAAAADLLGDSVSGRDAETLPMTVLRLLVEQGATVAVAESLTGGALAAAMVDIAGASAVFRGGVVAYATDLKTTLLGVDRQLVADGGAVQPAVAVAMARGARDRLHADYGVATTGVAGPDLQDGAPPGTVHVAVAGPGADDVRASALLLPGGRDRVRQLSVINALDLLRRALVGREQRV
jgi:nicotinamide-nucleotide amidase